jgi:subtilisin family serine protease
MDERRGTRPARRRRLLVAGLAACTAIALSATSAVASNDRYFDDQWNLTQLRAPEAWARSTGSGIKIGVVDGGIDAGHPDLAGKIDAMADCVGGTCREGGARDTRGHGTAVAGIAAAHANNGDGIAGVAPDARLVVARALSDRGGGNIEDINKAIAWVVDHGARVVNLSLGDPNFTLTAQVGTPLRSGIEYAWSRGAIPVLAAGNYEDLRSGGSANYGDLNAVVVGATDKQGNVPRYSTALGNAKWGVVAPGGSGDGPGVDVPAPAPGNRYAWTAGTSMAAPHVSAVLAMLLAQGLDPSAAVQRLLATVDSTTSCGVGCRGRVNASAAVALPVVPPSTPPAAVVTPPAVSDDDVSPALAAVAVVLALLSAAATLSARWWLPGRTR